MMTDSVPCDDLPGIARPASAEDVRARLDGLLRQSGMGYAAASRLIGRNAAYVQQFIRRGVPRALSERDRRSLARHFGISETWLGAPDDPEPSLWDQAGAEPLQPTLRIPWLDEPGAGARRPPMPLDVALAHRMSEGRPDDLAAFLATGDAMSPTIVAGDQLLVDRRTEPLRDGLYLLRCGSRILVRRLGLLPASGRLSVRCDNPVYGEEEGDAGALDILGRVLWIGRVLP
jgi:hypothetical protein